MNSILKAAALAALSLLGIASEAQTLQTQTTLKAAVSTASQDFVVLSSTTSVIPGSTLLYVDNEAMSVYNVNATNGQVSVVRGVNGTKAFAHKTGTMVMVGPTGAFISYDPNGACTNGTGLFLYSPVINTLNGNQWLCSTVTGKVVPGFANSADLPQVTTAVASAASLITPSGPLFHITGTAAITGFNIPLGFDPTAGGTICAIPDGAFTTTTANNIAVASTATVGRVMCWAYDGNTAKFYPYY